MGESEGESSREDAKMKSTFYIVTGLINLGRDEVVVDSGYKQYRVHHSLERAKEHQAEIAKNKPGWVTKIYSLKEVTK